MQIYNDPSSYDAMKNKKQLDDNYKPYQLIIFFLVGWLGFQLLGLIIELVFELIFKENFIDPETKYVNPLINSFFTLVTYLLLAGILVSLLYFFNPSAFKKIVKNFGTKETYLAAIMFFAIYYGLNILVNFLMLAIEKMFNIVINNSENQAALETMIKVNPFAMIFTTCFLAPICEETTYRLGLYSLLAKKNNILAFIVTVLFFTLIHLDFISPIINNDYSTLANEALNIPGYLVGASILTFAYAKHKRLSDSILTHCFVNSFSMIFILISSFLPQSQTVLINII